MKNKEEDDKPKKESSFLEWELTINPDNIKKDNIKKDNIKKESSLINEDSKRRSKAFMKEWKEKNL